MHQSLFELFVQMGPFAKGIVGLLAVMSMASLAAGVERLLVVRAMAPEIERFEEKCRSVLAAGMSDEARREAYDRAIRSGMLEIGSKLRRGLGLLATVGSTAPFVGLVGTVAGIINAFGELANSQHGGIGMISAGIAEALVTTGFGIGVAIPAVWLFNYITHRIAELLNEVERRAQDLAVDTLSRGSHGV